MVVVNKSSVFIKVALVFAGFYILYSAAFFIYYVDDSYDQERDRATNASSDYAKIGHILLRDNQVLEANERLTEAMEHYNIDFFFVRKDGKSLFYGNHAGTTDEIEFPVPTDGIVGRFDDPQQRYQLFLVKEGPYELFVGHKTSTAIYLLRFWQRERLIFLKDFCFVLLGLIAVVLYTFRDLRALLRRITGRGSARGDESIAYSKETLTLIRGFKGFEEDVGRLMHQNGLLDRQLLPALKNELFSGKTPPYEFKCTLVRTDINDFTKVFASSHRAEFMQTINDFFVEVTHVVSRYGGYVHEFVGDEVLYYFKDDEHEGSPAIALAAIRDVNAVAEEFHNRKQRDYPFRVKTSLAHGTLRFGPLVNGFSLAGNPLIETARMLMHVNDKSENTVVLDAHLRREVGSVCKFEEFGEVILKGLAEPRKLLRYIEHVPLRVWLQNEKHLGAKDSLLLYRGEKDIADLLWYVKKSWRDVPSDRSTHTLQNFKKFKLTRGSQIVKDAYLALLNDLLHDQIAQKKEYVLSMVVSIAVHLFRREDFDSELRASLMECLFNQGRRVVANGVDVFSELDPDSPDDVFIKLMRDSDNRVRANTLIREGKRSWSKSMAKKIAGMLDSPNPFFKASGLYALGEIALHMKNQDSVSFHASAPLQSLLKKAERLENDENPMIARQAKLVSEKTSSRPSLKTAA